VLFILIRLAWNTLSGTWHTEYSPSVTATVYKQGKGFISFIDTIPDQSKSTLFFCLMVYSVRARIKVNWTILSSSNLLFCSLSDTAVIP
jgi:hypothetical protein